MEDKDVTPISEVQEPEQEQKPKRGRKPKAADVTIRNTTGRPITLPSGKAKVTILPTEVKTITEDAFQMVKDNKAAMSFFESGELEEV